MKKLKVQYFKTGLRFESKNVGPSPQKSQKINIV